MARARIRLPGVQQLRPVRHRAGAPPARRNCACICRPNQWSPRRDGAAVIDGAQWIECTKAHSLGCNWLVPEEQDEVLRGRCLADSLIRREPDADDTIAQEKLADTTTAMHRLVLQLLRHRPARRPVLAQRRRPGLRSAVELQRGQEGHDRTCRRGDHDRPRRIPRRLPRVAAGAARRALPHHARPLPPRGRPLLPAHPGRNRPRRRPLPRRLPRAVRRRTRRLPGRNRAALQVRAARGLAGVVHLRVRHHASVGGLRGVLRALSAHHRHHRHRPRGRPGPARRQGALRGSAGHRSAGVL